MDGRVRPGLMLQAAAGAVRGALRAQAAALHTLPAAAAARRAVERAQPLPLSAPYVRRRHHTADGRASHRFRFWLYQSRFKSLEDASN